MEFYNDNNNDSKRITLFSIPVNLYHWCYYYTLLVFFSFFLFLSILWTITISIIIITICFYFFRGGGNVASSSVCMCLYVNQVSISWKCVCSNLDSLFNKMLDLKHVQSKASCIHLKKAWPGWKIYFISYSMFHLGGTVFSLRINKRFLYASQATTESQTWWSILRSSLQVQAHG